MILHNERVSIRTTVEGDESWTSHYFLLTDLPIQSASICEFANKPGTFYLSARLTGYVASEQYSTFARALQRLAELAQCAEQRAPRRKAA